MLDHLLDPLRDPLIPAALRTASIFESLARVESLDDHLLRLGRLLRRDGRVLNLLVRIAIASRAIAIASTVLIENPQIPRVARERRRSEDREIPIVRARGYYRE